MTWIPYEKTHEVAAMSAAILPVGSFEQHGPHLPLATDTLIACTVAERIAREYELFLLPPITISCSHEHSAWPGTVSISANTLANVINDIRASLEASGIHRLILINGHGGNYVLSNVVQQGNANSTTPCLALYPGRTEWAAARNAAGVTTGQSEDMHAGELETSILLEVKPEVVEESFRHADHDADERPHLLMTGVRGYSESGVIGRPSLATAAKGSAVLDSLVDQFSDLLKLLI